MTDLAACCDDAWPVCGTGVIDADIPTRPKACNLLNRPK
jgi:hypothetical protein